MLPNKPIERAGLHPANINGGGQVVAAGSPDGLARLAADPPARARVIPLEVAGAFHTPYMAPAMAEFEPVATGWAAADPQILLLSNADGAPYAAPCFVLVGNESRGLPEAYEAACDLRVLAMV